MKQFLIFIVGYFDRFNLGDDAFKYIYEHSNVLDQSKQFIVSLGLEPIIEFHSIDDIPFEKSCNLLLLAGGDLLNHYFINKINLYVENHNPLVYILSCGGIESYYNGKDRFLDVFDRIAFRNETDLELATKRFPKQYCNILPDIAFGIYPNNLKFRFGKKNRNNLGIYFTQPLICQQVYESVSNQIVLLVQSYSLKYPDSQIYFISFNTDPNNNLENDNEFYNKIAPDLVGTNSFLINKSNVKEMIQWIDENVDVGICWRFHSHIFHISCGIPFWSFAQSNKVKRIMKDYNLIEYTSVFEKEKDILQPLADSEWIKCFDFITNDELMEIQKQFLNSNTFKSKIINLNSFDENNFNLSKKVLELYSDLILNWLKKDLLLNNNIENSIVIKKRDFVPIFLNEQKLKKKTFEICFLIVNVLKEYYGIPIQKDLQEVIASSIQFMQLNIKDLIKIFKHMVMKSLTNFETIKLKFKDLSNEEIENLCFQIAESISFYITTDFQSKYFYGIFESLRDKIWDVKEAIRWLLQEWNDQDGIILSNHLYEAQKEFEHYKEILHVEGNKRLNLDFSHLAQLLELNKIHRAGWSYCIFPLLGLNVSLTKSTSSIKKLNDESPIIDIYGDKTFGWRRSMYEKMGILPFKKNWYSFFHHTFDANYTNNNLLACFESKSFFESLTFCKGIIVLSNYLKEQCEKYFISKFGNSGIKIPPVYVLFHPSEEPSQSWELQKFLRNENRKLIQVGAWYRNTYSIYDLPLLKDYKNPLQLKKCALKGKMMENYYLPPNTNIQIHSENNVTFQPEIKACLCGLDSKLIQDSHQNKKCKCDLLSIYNRYLHGMNASLKEKHESVKLICHLPDQEFDNILCENIVYLNLVDASACNTVIECMLRNCPVLVNKHPAVVEYLGDSYPMYYENCLEAIDKLQDINLIESAHNHLCNLDKSKLYLKSFVNEFLNIISI